MDQQDVLKRSYSTLTALKEHLSSSGPVHEKYVNEYHRSLDNLTSIGLDVSEFRIPENELRFAWASSNYITGETEYHNYKEMEKSYFLLKLDSLLNYFSLISDRNPQRVGFKTK